MFHASTLELAADDTLHQHSQSDGQQVRPSQAESRRTNPQTTKATKQQTGEMSGKPEAAILTVGVRMSVIVGVADAEHEVLSTGIAMGGRHTLESSMPAQSKIRAYEKTSMFSPVPRQ